MSKKSATGLTLILMGVGLVLLAGGVVVAILLARSASDQAIGGDRPRIRVTPATDAGPTARAPEFAPEQRRPTESDVVFSRRVAAKKRYLDWAKEEGLSEAEEAALRALLRDYQRRFFAVRVANIAGTSDAGTAEEQIRGYQRIDGDAMRSLRRLLGDARMKSFLARFKHPRALIVHRFFAD